jgi:hypothetical protein
VVKSKINLVVKKLRVSTGTFFKVISSEISHRKRLQLVFCALCKMMIYEAKSFSHAYSKSALTDVCSNRQASAKVLIINLMLRYPDSYRDSMTYPIMPCRVFDYFFSLFTMLVVDGSTGSP